MEYQSRETNDLTIRVLENCEIDRVSGANMLGDIIGAMVHAGCNQVNSGYTSVETIEYCRNK